jgi:hypothetical protein
LPPAGTWFLRGTTADGRRFVVQTLTGTDDRVRLLLSLGTPEPVLRGFPDPCRAPAGAGTAARRPGRRGRRTGQIALPRGRRHVAADHRRRGAAAPAAGEVEVTTARGQAVRVRLA